MSLLFGNLTQDFVAFATVVYAANTMNDPTAKAGLPAAAAHFRTTAGLDAGYLACIGKTTF